jgi:SAM-dependent methyltransferase
MGMLTYDALVLSRASDFINEKESVLTLGVPKLNFSTNQYQRARRAAGFAPINSFNDHHGFFRNLGFHEIESLDVSDYEGATILGDLNDPELPTKIGRQFDLIYDSGTLEHVFNAPIALQTLVRMVSPGGIIVHATPTNGFMDHGFWQVSPDLFHSFYRSQGFRLLTSAIFVLGGSPVAFRAEDNIYRTRGRDFIVGTFPEAIAIFAAQKTDASSASDMKLQDYYRDMYDNSIAREQMSFFVPYGSPVRAKIERMPFGTLAMRAVRKLESVAGRVLGAQTR